MAEGPSGKEDGGLRIRKYMMGGRRQETRGTASCTHEPAHFQQPLPRALPLTPVPVTMAAANTYGRCCCCLCIRAAQMWEPLAQVTATGWIPLWYHLSQHEFWETIATCSLHDALLNRQLLFCAGFTFRVISVYSPKLNGFSRVTWSWVTGGTSAYEKHSPMRQEHCEQCLCHLSLT